MPSTLDHIDPATRALLRVLLDVYQEHRRWPVRQYVARTLHDRGLDLTSVLQQLPSWQHNYMPVTIDRPHEGGELAEVLAPTMHGLVHADHPAAVGLVEAFLAGVAVGYERQQQTAPNPLAVQDLRVSAAELETAVANRLGYDVDGRQLRFMLQREPATWLGVAGSPDTEGWEWNLSRGSLQPYATTTGIEYLTALEHLVGIPDPIPDADMPLDPLALARALDHLDITWLAATGKRLLRRRSSTVISSVALPAHSGEEFEARCSALADVLSTIDVSSDKDELGALNKLKSELARYIHDPAVLARAESAVDRLRDIVALRAGQQHSGALPKGVQAATRLGIRFTGDWNQMWTKVRRISIDALYSISDAVDTQLSSQA